MSTGQTLADQIKGILESVEGLEDARFYTYYPNLSKLQEIVDWLTDSDGRVNAWFIVRSGLTVTRWGEGRKVPSQHRIKTHTFTIRGFVSVFENSTASEVDFQNLCDRIEEALGASMSLGIQVGTTIARGIGMSIGYEMLGKVLCHSCSISVVVDEYLATNYVL